MARTLLTKGFLFMPLTEPYPTLPDLMRLMGEAGQRLTQIGACKGAAGNISVYIGWETFVGHHFPRVTKYTLPIEVPELAGKLFLVTGSGRRLGEIADEPQANLAAVRINPGGKTGDLCTSPRALFENPTSEFNSHLALHRSIVLREKIKFHAIVHAQPPYLTYLSHIPGYQDTDRFSRRILRWQPETVVNLPMGVAYMPFELPGSPALMQGTVDAMEDGHRLVVWGKHGVLARSDMSIKRASDRVEYAETGAHYEYLNLTAGGRGVGLTDEELHAINEDSGANSPLY